MNWGKILINSKVTLAKFQRLSEAVELASWSKYISPIVSKLYLLKKILFIYFLERGEGREKERERNINVWLLLTQPLLGT